MDPVEQARRSAQQLAALDAAVREISVHLDLDRLLQVIVDRVRDLVDAEYAALGTLGPDGSIDRFITSGIDDATRARIGHPPSGRGLLGLIIREARAFRFPDIAADPRRYGFPPHHPVMHAFLGVPVTVKGRSVGNLYLTNKRSAAEFSEDDQRVVEMFALHAGIAIENARLHHQVQRLAVVEERERIGRDLHDGIIQRLYGVTLSLDDVEELVESDPAEARQRVDRAIEAAGASGYLLKQIRGRDLVSALESVARGDSLLDPAVTEKVLERVRRIASGQETDELAQLTAQERKILFLVAEGKTNKEIAGEVFLSDKTVKNYVSSILSKLNLQRRTQAAAFVAQHRLRPPE